MARKKRRSKAHYSVNPWTGRRERVAGSGERQNILTGKIEKVSGYSFGAPRSRRPRKLSAREQRYQQRVVLFMLAMVLIFLFFYWASTHIWEAIAIGLLVIGIAVLVFLKIPRLRNMLDKTFKTYSSVTDEEVKKLISEIKSINMQEVRNEEDFEKQVYQWLNAKGFDIDRQVLIEGHRRIDLVVDKRIALELKVADRAKNVQDLIGQVTIYKKHYKNILVVILDVGNVANMSEYIELIQNIDPENIGVVLVNGDLRRYKKKEEFIMVKKSTSYD